MTVFFLRHRIWSSHQWKWDNPSQQRLTGDFSFAEDLCGKSIILYIYKSTYLILSVQRCIYILSYRMSNIHGNTMAAASGSVSQDRVKSWNQNCLNNFGTIAYGLSPYAPNFSMTALKLESLGFSQRASDLHCSLIFSCTNTFNNIFKLFKSRLVFS